jgi:hypothetical protein
MGTQPRLTATLGRVVALSTLIGILFLVGCNNNGNKTTYKIGVTVSGLSGSNLVLQDNGGNNLTVSTNGMSNFTTQLASGAAYDVTVFSQPTSLSQTCTPVAGSGTVMAAGVDVLVGCQTDTFAVGGTVSGLAGAGLVLQDNGGNNLPVSANGSFAFTTDIASGATYAVTVLTEPSVPTQTCVVASGSGPVTTAAITTVAITCTPPRNYTAVTDGTSRVLIYDAPLSTGQSAGAVLGQTNFTAQVQGTTASTMNSATAAVADATANLYVAESDNCRVTQFRPPFSNGMSASLVIGEPNFTTSCSATVSATILGNAWGVAFDHTGNLWVTDYGNSRVLEYLPPFSNGMAATLAIGQPNLTSGVLNQGGASPTAATLANPIYAVFDSSGNLWVPDFNNNRLLEFTPPLSTGKAASVELGQPDFVSNSILPTAANTISGGPGGTAFDSSGNLWVADIFDNRVLEFVPPFTSNMNASLVLGQTDFVSFGAATSGASGMNGPIGIAFDSTGNLFVIDNGNNRTLVFEPPFTTGMNATLVLGQPNFTTTAASVTAAGETTPNGVTTAH